MGENECVSTYQNTAFLYDIDYAVYPQMNKDIDFYCRSSYRAEKILEIGSGTGRITFEIAKLSGKQITALDMSEQMLAELRKKLGTKKVRSPINMVCESIVDYESRDKYDLILAPGRVLSAVCDRDDIVKALKNIRKLLDEEGIFILDVFGISEKSPVKKEYDFRYCYSYHDEERGLNITKYHSCTDCDYEHNIYSTTAKFDIDDAEGRHYEIMDRNRLKFYCFNEILGLLQQTGFTVIGSYGDYDRGRIKDGSNYIFVCKKN